MNLHKITKISNTQQGNIDNVWHPTEKLQGVKSRKMKPMRRRNMTKSHPGNDIADKITRQGH